MTQPANIDPQHVRGLIVCTDCDEAQSNGNIAPHKAKRGKCRFCDGTLVPLRELQRLAKLARLAEV